MPIMAVKPDEIISFTYTNHRGETKRRTIKFLGVDFGSNEWYATPQWFIRGEDMERPGVIRSFAVVYIQRQPEPTKGED